MNRTTLMSAGALLLACLGCQAERHAEAPSAMQPKEEGWRTTFAVDKANLGTEGKNPYFDLTPGTVTVFKEGAVTLTVTVLKETRVVDGVTTRIVEEHEEKGGQPQEISRNFFAIDRTTGDVFYMGEEVDIYENGKVVNHDGAWLSGVAGARFGLAIAAKPRVGDKYHQEIAPGVAMDRNEIVSVEETVKTPAGTFEHCVHVRETTPLEPDVSHKWFAPGVGLVKDGKAERVSPVVKRP